MMEIRDASDEVAKNQLQKSEIAGIRDGRNTNDGQRGCFRRHDGKRQGPPGRVSSSEEIVGGATLVAAEVQAQRSYAEEVSNDDRQVQWMNAHRNLCGKPACKKTYPRRQRAENSVGANLSQEKSNGRGKNTDATFGTTNGEDN